MKLDPNCVRDILLEIEKLPYQKTLLFSELTDSLASYDEDTISYCCLKLSEAEYLDISTYGALGKKITVTCINDITFKGHEFLNNVRSNTIWNNVKSISGKIGVTSIQSLAQIAVGVMTALINQQLGI